MEAKERLEKIMEYKGWSVPIFASRLGVTAQNVYDVLRGRTNRLSPRLRTLIEKRLPEISPTWLVTGEGEMFTTPIPADLSPQDTAKLIDLLQAKEESLAKAQDHITKLLNILSQK